MLPLPYFICLHNDGPMLLCPVMLVDIKVVKEGSSGEGNE